MRNDIIAASVFLRKNNNKIPSEVIEFMKQSALKAWEEAEINAAKLKFKNMAFVNFSKEDFQKFCVSLAKEFDDAIKAGFVKNKLMVIRGTIRGKVKNEIWFVNQFDGEEAEACMIRHGLK